jgi:ribosomal protein S3
VGQKVHPEGLRVGYIHDWKSNWFNERDFADYLHEDIRIRDHIEGKLSHAGLSTITIRKDKNEVTVDIHTARPGIVIGKSGAEVDALRRELHKMTNKQVRVNILEVKRPELDAKLVAQSIAEQLQNRVAFRRAMKRAITSAMRSGAVGIRVQVSGRLGGSGVLLRGPRAAAHAACRHRLRPARGAHHLWPHRRQVLDQQGRGDAGRLRASRGRRAVRRPDRPATARRPTGWQGPARRRQPPTGWRP